jgi:hypothetical protein
MRNLKRNEVDLNNSMISIGLRLLNYESKTHEYYIQKLENYEKRCEDRVIEFLRDIKIDASVKTIPESLPYKNEIVNEFHCRTYINEAFDFSSVLRSIAKELLQKNVTKIRFYFYIDFHTVKKPAYFGEVIYKFRYYEH